MAFRRITGMHPAFLVIILCITAQHQLNAHQQITIKDIFKSQTDLVALVRVPRQAGSPPIPTQEDVVVRKARDSKYYSGEDKYRQGYKDETRGGGVLKQDAEDDQAVKGGTGLGKRCTTCEPGYLRGRGGYDRNDRDPYASYYSRGRYDPYDSYGRDGYADDYDRDYRGRTRYPYSSYERYDPRERYYDRAQEYDRGLSYDRGQGYDNRGYDYRERSNYIPYYRDRYDPLHDDYYNRGLGTSGYDAYSGRGYYARPDYYGGSGVYAGNGAYGGGYGGNGGYGGGYGGSGNYGGGGVYARGYSYGDRDRYVPNNGYGDSGYGYGSGSYGANTYRSRYPTSNDYDSGYRYRSYLHERPSSTTVDPPKNADNEPSNTASPQQGSSSGRI